MTVLACESSGHRWLVNLSDHQTKAKGGSIRGIGGNTEDDNGNCENGHLPFHGHLAPKGEGSVQSSRAKMSVACPDLPHRNGISLEASTG